MWTLGVLLPHAPILVPEIAERTGSVPGRTLPAFLSVKDRLIRAYPDVLLVLDPHAATGKGFTLIQAGMFTGDLGQFGAASISLTSEGSPDGAGEELSREIQTLFPVRHYRPTVHDLDYAAVVPLHFLKLAMGSIPPLVIANPVTISYREAYLLGKHLGNVRSKMKWGLLASGDLSHRLTSTSPSGYHPDGEVLDEAIKQALRSSCPDPIFDLEPFTIENAGECGLRSVLALLGLSQGAGVELLSYEAPFGVGYATAVWLEGGIDRHERN